MEGSPELANRWIALLRECLDGPVILRQPRIPFTVALLPVWMISEIAHAFSLVSSGIGIGSLNTELVCVVGIDAIISHIELGIVKR